MRIVAAFVLLWLMAAPAASQSDAAQDAAWAALARDGAVALVRHAAAPGGAGDPDGVRLDDCATQRNLSAPGRDQARALGVLFRERRIATGRVVASQWCRCRETATLMDLGPVADAPTFNNAYVLRRQADALTAGARQTIAGWRGPGALVVVTHGQNIRLLTGVDPGEGGVVVVRPDGEGFAVVGRIAPPT